MYPSAKAPLTRTDVVDGENRRAFSISSASRWVTSGTASPCSQADSTGSRRTRG
ncbi:hypothetical protein ACFQX7_36975 [Luedemannella flava]